MNTPGSAEGGSSLDEGAPVSSEGHGGDTPFNSKLLDNDDTTMLVVLGDLGEVDGRLRRRNSNTHAVQSTPCNELAKILAGNLDRGSNEPPKAINEDGIAAIPPIRNWASHQRSNDAAGCES